MVTLFASLHPAPLHFFAGLVILFPLPGWRFRQCDFHDRSPVQAAFNRCIERSHVGRKEPLAYCPQCHYLLGIVFHQLCTAYSHGRFVLQGETAVLRPHCRRASGNGRQRDHRICGDAIQFFPFRGAVLARERGTP